MKNTLTVCLFQTDPCWKAKEKNLAVIDQKLCVLPKNTDLVLLPEMFATGFVTDAHEIAETMDGPTVRWMQKRAKQWQIAIAGSIAVKEKNHVFNRFVFTDEHGKISTYDKRHLFAFAKEDRHYSAGKTQSIIEYKGWKIAPFVCYDLRFPVWSRNTKAYDLCVYVANWPNERIEAWDSLLKARAIENTCYCIGVNRVGTDGKNLYYTGNSQAIDPMGSVFKKAFEASETVLRVVLDKTVVNGTRKKFPFLEDRDFFELK